MLEEFQATSEERTSNPKWSDTQILSKLTLEDGDLLFEFLDIEGSDDRGVQIDSGRIWIMLTIRCCETLTLVWIGSVRKTFEIVENISMSICTHGILA